MPFRNLSGDPEQDYFADGVVEDIIAALSRNRWLFVIARNSSFAYKGRSVDVKQVGRELGVRYVLEGSVRKAANRVRITGQLIDATTGAHLWADRFEGTLDDIFELQDQLTASVVGAIAPQLERAEIERAKRKPTGSLDAYDYYLRGMAQSPPGNAGRPSTRRLPLFYRAIELDPDFASAYGMAAWCHFWRKINGWMSDPAREIAEGARLARRAVELGKDDAVALTRAGHALGHLARRHRGRHRLARQGRHAQSEPGGGLVSRRIPQGLARRFGGRHRAFHPRHAPQPPGPRRSIACRPAWRVAHLFARRFDAAASWAEKSFRELPSFLMVVSILAASQALAGRNGGSAASDGASAPPRSGAAHLQSPGMAPDPPPGGSRHFRRRPAKGRAAGVMAVYSLPLFPLSREETYLFR